MNNTISNSSNLSKINEIALSGEYLLGNWQSKEQDWPINLSISKKLNLIFLKTEKRKTKAIFNSKNEFWVFLK